MGSGVVRMRATGRRHFAAILLPLAAVGHSQHPDFEARTQ
jgi:hypothetical protein